MEKWAIVGDDDNYRVSNYGRVQTRANRGPKKKPKGKYTYINYTAMPDVIKELDFYLRITEPVLTYLTVKINDVADLENANKPNPKDLM